MTEINIEKEFKKINRSLENLTKALQKQNDILTKLLTIIGKNKPNLFYGIRGMESDPKDVGGGCFDD